LAPMIGRDGLRYTKPIDNMFFNKINHIAWCHSLDWDGFNPLREAICSHQYEFYDLCLMVDILVRSGRLPNLWMAMA
jgi:hypothetical protein